MNELQPAVFSVFLGSKRLATGPLRQVALVAKKAVDRGAQRRVLIYNDSTGRSIDIDVRGCDAELLAKLADDARAALPRGRGRPRLGVVARDVTLLPHHWQWLSAQPGGASVAIRKLVDAARQTHQYSDRQGERQAAAFQFMSAMAHDQANFEEAARALSSSDRERFGLLTRSWPVDVRDHAIRLAFGDTSRSGEDSSK
jgi:uncharacterized protein